MRSGTRAHVRTLPAPWRETIPPLLPRRRTIPPPSHPPKAIPSLLPPCKTRLPLLLLTKTFLPLFPSPGVAPGKVAKRLRGLVWPLQRVKTCQSLLDASMRHLICLVVGTQARHVHKWPPSSCDFLAPQDRRADDEVELAGTHRKGSAQSIAVA